MTKEEKLRRFDAEISPHLRSAYNLARWLTRSHDDAEDVVQDAFLRAYTSFEGFRGADGRPWLLAIVRNVSMTLLKRNRGSAQVPEFEDIVEQASAPDPDPESLMLASCDQEQIREAVANLPLEFRETLILRELEELSYKEIATITGVPIGTVMSRLARGRHALRGMLTTRKKGAGRI